MDVILVSASAKPGGAERGVAGLCRQLPQHGVRPSVLLLERGPVVEQLLDSGVEVSVIEAGRLRHAWRTASAVNLILRAVRARGADAIVSNLSMSHVYGGAAARRARIPEIWWQQETPSRTLVERAAARIPTSAVVCLSDHSLAAQARLTPRARLVKIPSGVNVDELHAARGTGASLRQQLGWDGRPVVGILGRLQPWKGQELFLRAAALVAAEEDSARFAVVGGAILGWEGDYPDRLHQLAADLGIADRVHFSGHVDDPYAWLDMFDVAVHASKGEPFGLVIVEAMALGKPVVAAAAGGPREIVEDGESGVLVPRREADYASAVLRLLRDQSLRARLASRAPQRASWFSDERMAAEFAALFAAVSTASGRGRRP